METERLETQFVSLTGASLSEASQILQMNGFDLQRAVDMYYNNMNEMDDIIDEPVSYTNSKRYNCNQNADIIIPFNSLDFNVCNITLGN